ncbi:MAG: right-handed parallel beta-helix repeat-containing protein [Gemmataceae bacterium]|nr:right-handed parallel beta-helix repeat-containing protein [Gemmataceae bacterium]MDW8265931.1 right-handed parallel beta-helix repeat-containing protein [Gemmataceae bacterium]
MSNVRDFGAKGDGRTDDTAAISHAVQQGDGELVFPRGDYLISRPIHLSLAAHGRLHVRGSGGAARLIMAGPGPALHLVGTHLKTAFPSDFTEEVWVKERMPTVFGLEILGRHPEADGIRVEGAMQPSFHAVLIRRCRQGIHLTNRARNVLISDCHIYDLSGIGVYLDRVNLHQVNISGNHISYCRRGGIVVVGSEIRNIQICGNDIEYNFEEATDRCADVFFDGTEGSIREGTIVGNTIQAKESPRGANVRFLCVGKNQPNAVGMLTITGNLIGSQETAIDLRGCRGVVISGNCLYSGYRQALVAEDSEHLVIAGNSIDHNPDYRGPSTDRIVFRRCRHVSLTGLVLQHTKPAATDVPSSIEVHACEDINITGCQLVRARTRGIDVEASSLVRIADCTIRGPENDPNYLLAVRIGPGSSRVMVVNNFLGKGKEGELVLQADAGIAAGNVTI